MLRFRYFEQRCTIYRFYRSDKICCVKTQTSATSAACLSILGEDPSSVDFPKAHCGNVTVNLGYINNNVFDLI